MTKSALNLLIFVLLCSLSAAALAQDAQEIKRHYQLGQIYYELGLYKEAEAELQKALELSKTKPETKAKINPAVLQKQGKDAPSVPLEQPSVSEKASEGAVYVIDEGDVLAIRVWENTDLNQDVIVRPDGKISFPLINEVQAKGLTISELDQAMSDRLKEFIRFPDVSISLVKMGGSKIILLGEVKYPGVYTISGKKTILEVIAMAQGFTSDSVASSVILVRGGFSQPQGQRVNLNDALHNPASKQNVMLQSNDIVFVPKKFIADVNYVLREILEPLSRGAAAYGDFNSF